MNAKSTVTKTREEMERDTLRLLCSVLVRPVTRIEICRLLHAFDFLDALRRTVFEEIRDLGTIGSRRLRSALSARVRNRGYLDFSLDRMLAPKLAGEQEIGELFESTLCLLKLGGFAHPTLVNSGANENN